MALIKVNINDLDIVTVLDPAISERLKAARTAILTAGITPSARIIVLDYWVGRQGDPLLVIQKMLEQARRWQPRVLGIEMIAFQKALKPFTEREMARQGLFYPIVELKPDHNGRIVEKKNQRILSMQPFFKTGQIYIQKGMLDLIEEYETFPLGSTVDLLDILSYAIRLLVPSTQSRKSQTEIACDKLKAQDHNSYKYWRAYLVSKGLVEPEIDPLDEDDNFSYERPSKGVGELV